jgi:hypothetical protein
LSPIEGDGLPFTKVIEPSFTARRIVEEVLVAIAGENETEPFVTDEAFDCAVHGRHSDLLDSSDTNAISDQRNDRG